MTATRTYRREDGYAATVDDPPPRLSNERFLIVRDQLMAFRALAARHFADGNKRWGRYWKAKAEAKARELGGS